MSGARTISRTVKLLTSLTPQRTIPIERHSDIAVARLVSQSMGMDAGLAEYEVDTLGFLGAECASNILKHAGTGALRIGETRGAASAIIELVALDVGPGIARHQLPSEAGRDSARSSGLQAMFNRAHAFDIYAPLGKGTALLMRVGGTGEDDLGTAKFGAAWSAFPGQYENGDLWALQRGADTLTLMVCDGLGHGPMAAQASRTALMTFAKRPELGPLEQIEALHGALHDTFGAALALIEVAPAERRVRFCGIGNIVATIIDGAGATNLVSHVGVVGHKARKIQEFCVPFEPGAIIVLHSDGIKSRWRLDDYPGLSQCSAAMIAAILLRDFRRLDDDATAVVIKL